MSEQALDLRRSMRIVRRHKILVGSFVALGILAGAAYAVIKPPMVTSQALIGLPPATKDTSTQVVIADSNPVLAAALRNIHPAVPLLTLRNRIQVKSLTPNILQVSAQGKTATEAQDVETVLEEGDSLYFEADVEHWFENRTSRSAEYYLVISAAQIFPRRNDPVS